MMVRETADSDSFGDPAACCCVLWKHSALNQLYRVGLLYYTIGWIKLKLLLAIRIEFPELDWVIAFAPGLLQVL